MTKPVSIFREPGIAPSYWLTRFVILRLLGLVYAIAFLVAINQVVPLIGSHGLLPLDSYFTQVSHTLGSAGKGFVRLPSIFWLGRSDTALLITAWLGFIIALMVTAGYTNALLMGLLWFMYMSFVHAGQDWYGYGWEIQLNETGFLAIFLCPLLDMRPFPRQAPPFPIIVLFRWLIFRIMFGSGMIKYRGDATWRNSTALYYYFETQPIPGPFTRWFHFLPRVWLRIGVWFNWLAELMAPWFVFGPRLARHIAGVIIVLLQLSIVVSGNLSFLNWLTIVPALACFDDSFWARILPQRLVKKAEYASVNEQESRPMTVTAWAITALIALFSVQPTLNILSPNQVMNTSFDPLDLVNTYGAFGGVGQERYNVVFEGTSDTRISDSTRWKPYLYKGLPVLPDQRPPQIAPYQLRLDWQMWFAAMSTADQYPWTYNLVWKLLHNDRQTIGLFANDPFPNAPPHYIRAVLYRYKFAPPGNPQGLYWARNQISEWIPPLSLTDPQLIRFLQYYGWLNKD